MPNIRSIAEGVRKAVQDKPERAAHGDTKYNAFYILKDGTIMDFEYGVPSRADLPHAPDVTLVHSHSAGNWKQWEELSGQLEPFMTLSLGDIKALRHMLEYRQANTLALIMGDGRLEVFHVPPNREMGMMNATDERLSREVEGTPEDRQGLYSMSADDIEWWDVDRVLMRGFAKKHDLVFLENLRWREPTKKVETLMKGKKPIRKYPMRKIHERPPDFETVSHKYYTSQFWNYIHPDLWPVVPIQPELTIERKGQLYTWQKTRPEPSVQMRFFGGGRLSGRIMNCGIWVQNPLTGHWYCGKYAPACEAQKRCRTTSAPMPLQGISSHLGAAARRLKLCAAWKQVPSRHYGKDVWRCSRYEAACTEGACLPEPMARPKEEPEEAEPSEKMVRDVAQAMAQEYNVTQAEVGPALAREILSRGGIASYRGRYLKEEYKEIPLHLKNKRGLPLDEMAAEMGMDEAELVAAIQKEYPKGRKTVRRKAWRDFMDEAYRYLTQQPAYAGMNSCRAWGYIGSCKE